MKLSQLTSWLGLFLLFGVLSCQKDSQLNHGEDLDPFVEEAKEAFSNTGYNQGKGNSTSSVNPASDIHPIWGRAFVSKTDLHKFTEVPLNPTFRELDLYGVSDSGNPTDMKAVANASFKHLLSFKRNGRFEQFVLTYVPDLNLVKENGKDYSGNYINKLANDFSGYIEFSNLNGIKLFVLRVTEGRVISKKMLRDRVRSSVQNKKGSKVSNCSGTLVPIWERTCVGDPLLPETIYCGEWEFSGWRYSYNCNDLIYYPPTPEDPNSPGGGGTPGTPSNPTDCMNPANFFLDECNPPPQLPVRDVHDTFTSDCLSSTLTTLRNAGLQNRVSHMLDSVFNKSPDLELYFEEVAMGVDTNAVYFNDGVQPDGHYKLYIRLNSVTMPNASREYITITMLHEVIHAYLEQVGSMGMLDHEATALKYRSAMADIVISLYSTDPAVAERLAWEGLQETAVWQTFINTYPTAAGQVKTANENYSRLGTSGTRCSP